MTFIVSYFVVSKVPKARDMIICTWAPEMSSSNVQVKRLKAKDWNSIREGIQTGREQGTAWVDQSAFALALTMQTVGGQLLSSVQLDVTWWPAVAGRSHGSPRSGTNLLARYSMLLINARRCLGLFLCVLSALHALLDLLSSKIWRIISTETHLSFHFVSWHQLPSFILRQANYVVP